MSLLELLSGPARQAATLEDTAHRPWPVPEAPWIQAQSWEQLLFAHWRVDAAELERLVPSELSVDTFDASGWLGITPFRVTNLRLRGLLPVPRLSSFLELNVRTYVRVGDRPGIYFFSLDAENPLAVEAARRTYRLPYFHARMSALERGGWIEYSSKRRDGTARFAGRYRPIGKPAAARPGSLEHFAAERYCLHTVDGGVAYSADVHHPSWPLQEAEAEIDENSMAPPGLELLDEQPLCHFSERQDVVIWPLERVTEVTPTAP